MGLMFPWAFTNSIKANLVTPYGSKTLKHNVDRDKDVRNLSG